MNKTQRNAAEMLRDCRCPQCDRWLGETGIGRPELGACEWCDEALAAADDHDGLENQVIELGERDE